MMDHQIKGYYEFDSENNKKNSKLQDPNEVKDHSTKKNLFSMLTFPKLTQDKMTFWRRIIKAFSLIFIICGILGIFATSKITYSLLNNGIPNPFEENEKKMEISHRSILTTFFMSILLFILPILIGIFALNAFRKEPSSIYFSRKWAKRLSFLFIIVFIIHLLSSYYLIKEIKESLIKGKVESTKQKKTGKLHKFVDIQYITTEKQLTHWEKEHSQNGKRQKGFLSSLLNSYLFDEMLIDSRATLIDGKPVVQITYDLTKQNNQLQKIIKILLFLYLLESFSLILCCCCGIHFSSNKYRKICEKKILFEHSTPFKIGDSSFTMAKGVMEKPVQGFAPEKKD